MTEILLSAGGAILGWVASVEYRLGQLMGMKDQVNQIHEHLLGKKNEGSTEERPGEGRG